MVINGTLSPKRSNFQPLPGLLRSDGDLTLYFLSANTVRYTKSTLDPWYQATEPVSVPVLPGAYGSKQNISMYTADEVASPLACVEQQQLCDPGASVATQGGGMGPNCTPLLSLSDFMAQAPALFKGKEKSLGRFRWTLLA